MPAPTRIRIAVVCCKRCHNNIPSGVEGVPSQPIVTRCLVCQEQRAYLPSEVFLGVPSYEFRRATRGQ